MTSPTIVRSWTLCSSSTSRTKVQSYFRGAELEERLELVLAEFMVRSKFDDPAVAQEVIDLCTHGLESHRLLLSASTAVDRILRTPHTLRIPEALAGAVIPASSRARIADETANPAEFRLALDLLAHLAGEQDSPVGERAIDLLLDITSMSSPVRRRQLGFRFTSSLTSTAFDC